MHTFTCTSTIYTSFRDLAVHIRPCRVYVENGCVEILTIFVLFLFLQGANTLKPLLDLALSHIPMSKLRSTPVALKATAGLRLLPPEKAQALLDAVSRISTCIWRQLYKVKLISTVLKNIRSNLKQIVWETVKWHWKFCGPSISWIIDGNNILTGW